MPMNYEIRPETGQLEITGYPAAITVRTREELSQALLQHKQPIIIARWWLALPFLLLLAVQGIPALERIAGESRSSSASHSCSNASMRLTRLRTM
jgi:hypothetical protein